MAEYAAHYTSDSASTMTDEVVTWGAALTYDFEDGESYAIFYGGLIQNNFQADSAGLALRNVDTSTNVQTMYNRIGKDSTDLQSISGLYIFTQSGDANVEWDLQFFTSSGNGTVTYGYPRIVILKLDSSLDKWVYDDDQETTTSTGFVNHSGALLSWTPGSSRDYMIFASAGVGNTAGTDSLTQIRLFDQTTAYGTISPTRATTTTVRPNWFTGVYKAGLSGAQAWDIEFGEASGATTAACRQVAILALDVTALPGTIDYSEARSGTSTTTNHAGTVGSGTSLDTLTPAVTIADRYLFMWGAAYGADNTAQSVVITVEAGGAFVGAGVFEEIGGTTIENSVMAMSVLTLTTTEPTYDLRYGDEGTITAEIGEAWMVLIQIPDPASGVEVTPASVDVTTSTVNPTVVLGSLSLTPAVNTATATTVNPSVTIVGPFITPAVLSVTTSTVNPTVVLGALALTPAAQTVTVSVVDPTIVLGDVEATPAVVSVSCTTVDPTVDITDGSITPDPIEVTTSTVNPTVVLGDDEVTPTVVSLTVTTVNPTVIISGSIAYTPTPVTANASTVNPSVVLGSLEITPAVISLTCTTRNPTVINSGDAPEAIARWLPVLLVDVNRPFH